MSQTPIIEQSHEKENGFKELFDYPEFNPELWAAKFGHTIGCGDLRKYSFRDKDFQTWVHRLFEILHNPNQLSELRLKLLNEEERKLIEKHIEDGF